MKKGVLILLILALSVCEWFTFQSRKDIKFIEAENNENYTEYIAHKDEFTLTEGTITEIYDPTERTGLDKLTATDDWLSIIEFEAGGQKVTDQFFPCDTDNDKVGSKVEIAYKPRTNGARGERAYSAATRTEYIQSTKKLRKNTFFIAGFGIGIGALIVWAILSGKK